MLIFSVLGQPRTTTRIARKVAFRAPSQKPKDRVGKHLFTVEHEVRSATHPMYLRPLVNRNPAVTNRTYAHGHDQWNFAVGPDQYDNR
jgi:hypothetical protein